MNWNQSKRALRIVSLSALAGVLLGMRICGRFHRRPSVGTLPKDDREVVTYDEKRHRVSVTTESGTTTAYSRNPTVEVRKDGTIRVDAHLWGRELRPFL